ncbi:MAG: DUF460 domain-containing protein [Candidatus Aenigmatarchaeota archaeon]
MKNLIIGYDSGLNVGVAILDTNGNVVFLKTYRGEDREKIISEILKFGRPIIISTDKRKIPKSIKEVASSFGCRVIKPKRDLLVEEKEEMVRKIGIEVKDEHQRDAVAAAYYAYKKIKKRLETIKVFLERKNLVEFYDEVVYKFFRDYRKNLIYILERLVSRSEEKIEESEKEEIVKQISFFEENLRLKKKIKDLEKELNYYRKINLIFSELIEYKEKFLKIEKYFNLLKKIYDLEIKNILAIIDIDKYDIYDLNYYIGLENKLVFSNDEKKFPLLKGFGIKALFTEVDIKDQQHIKYPVFLVKRSDLVNFDGIYGIERKKFEKMMKEVLKEEIKRWVEEERLK